MKRHGVFSLMVSGVFLGTIGCSPVISKGVKEQVDKHLGFEEVLNHPGSFKGKVVMWGGVIIDAKNQKEGTLLEVL